MVRLAKEIVGDDWLALINQHLDAIIDALAEMPAITGWRRVQDDSRRPPALPVPNSGYPLTDITPSALSSAGAVMTAGSVSLKVAYR